MSSAITQIHAAARDPALVVLEGFHAVKHALRFGADVGLAVTADRAATAQLARQFAPDVEAALMKVLVDVPWDAFRALAPRVHTGLVAVARRPAGDAERAVGERRDAPVVLLENPRNLSNLGAVIRVAAAADVAGVLSTGEVDPWDPSALRGSAGLHFALPVGRVLGPPSDRPLIGLDPDGEDSAPDALPVCSTLAFGTERDGITADLRRRCDALVALPMRPGVSSLNLATSVSAALYAWRLASRWNPSVASRTARGR